MSVQIKWDLKKLSANLLLPAMLLAMPPGASLAAPASSPPGQIQYTVKGKVVPRQVYQAVLMLNEALPLLNSGHLEQAREKLEQSLKLAGDLPEAQYNMAVCLSRLGQSEKAVPYLKALIDSGVDMPAAWVTLAGIYQNASKFKQAEFIYKDALSRFPANTWETIPELHYNYGLLLARLGQSQEAVEQLKLAIPQRSNQPGLWLSLGAVYQASGKLADSIAAYREFLKRFPDNSEAVRIRGAVSLMEKELKREGTASGNHGDTTDYFPEVTAGGVHRWQSYQMPLLVYMQPGQAVPGFQSVYAEIFKQCFQEWLSAAGSSISIQYVSDPEKATISLSWSNNPDSLSNRAEGGEAKLLVSQTGKIARAQITILTVPITPLRPVTANLIRFVCLHEIGHALGLSGHSSRPQDIMFFSSALTDRQLNLSSRDKNTIKRLYGSPPAASNDQSNMRPSPPCSPHSYTADRQ